MKVSSTKPKIGPSPKTGSIDIDALMQQVEGPILRGPWRRPFQRDPRCDEQIERNSDVPKATQYDPFVHGKDKYGRNFGA